MFYMVFNEPLYVCQSNRLMKERQDKQVDIWKFVSLTLFSYYKWLSYNILFDIQRVLKSYTCIMFSTVWNYVCNQ